MLPRLQKSIENAYRVFGRYRISNKLDVCRCNMCMSDEAERILVEAPLRSLAADELAEYTNSAHGWDASVATDMKYFLPRYFELIAQHRPPDNIGMNICLRRLAETRWKETWPQAESLAIDEFFDALILDTLEYAGPVQEVYGWRMKFQLSEILTLIITAGGDLDRALSIWNAGPDPQAVAHMAAMRGELLSLYGGPYLHSVFLDKHRAEAEKIGTFIMRPEVTARIESAFFASSDPQMQQMLSEALG